MSDSRSAGPAPSPATRSPSWPAGVRWRVRLFGTLDVEDAQGTRHARFPSRAIAALLARLALAPERAHAREALVELLWPGVELAVGRNRLRQALSTLKSLLEPAGDGTATPVLVADRQQVRVAPGALACDVREFEAALQEGRLADARRLYRGELMPGHYDDWVLDERLRLQGLFERIDRALAPGAATPDGRASLPSLPLPLLQTPTASPASPTAPAAAASAPPWLPLLPSYLTRWFGAPALRRRMHDEVAAHRLVTLLGPGGAGKTRLAVELATALAANDANGANDANDAATAAFDPIVFVTLLGTEAPEPLVEPVLAALGLRAQPGLASEAVLRQALAGRRPLIVLDNLEHLLPAAAPSVLGLVDALPQAHWLCTSRRRLDVDGERVFPLDALPLPPAPPQPTTLADAAASPAVQLFVDRARAARSDFHLSARNAAVLSALAHALGGLPLALELAAARIRSFSPSEMLQRLTRASGAAAVGAGRGGGTPALDLLARGGVRGARDARHASMEAVIGWSWAQLAPAEARLLAASTVFGGSFTAAALAFVAEDDDAALRLDSLQAHSMLRREPGGDAGGMAFAGAGAASGAGSGASGGDTFDEAPRFALLPPVREYAARRRACARATAAGCCTGPPVSARRRRWPSCAARCPTSPRRWPARCTTA